MVRSASIHPSSGLSVWLFGRNQEVITQLGALLSDEGYTVSQVQAATSAVPPGPPPDLLVANLEPPGTLDSAILRELWARHDVPLICVVPANSMAMIKMALDLRAHDVICKPVRPDELINRVAALLALAREKKPNGIPVVERRSRDRRDLPMTQEVSPRHEGLPPTILRIDDRAKRVYVNGNHVKLSPKEYQLVCLLSSEEGRVVSSREIAAHLWPNRHRLSGFEVQQYIHFIRRKLEVDPANPRLILTVKGFGYKLAEAEDLLDNISSQPMAG